MIGDICTKPAITASPDTTVREAAHRMRSRKVGRMDRSQLEVESSPQCPMDVPPEALRPHSKYHVSASCAFIRSRG